MKYPTETFKKIKRLNSKIIIITFQIYVKKKIQTDDKIKLIQNIKSNIREEYEMFTDSVSSDINVNQNQILKKDEKACQQMVKNKFF